MGQMRWLVLIMKITGHLWNKAVCCCVCHNYFLSPAKDQKLKDNVCPKLMYSSLNILDAYSQWTVTMA